MFPTSVRKDKKNKLNSSQKKGISSKDVTTESAIANSDPDYESSNDIESISEEDVSSSAAVGTQIHESNKDTERTSSQTLSTAKDEETPDPSLYSEHSFEYVEDALGHQQYMKTASCETAKMIQDANLSLYLKELEQKNQDLMNKFKNLL